MTAQIIGIAIVLILGGGFIAAAIYSLLQRGRLEELKSIAEKTNKAYTEAANDRKQTDQYVSGLTREQLVERMHNHTHRDD